VSPAWGDGRLASYREAILADAPPARLAPPGPRGAVSTAGARDLEITKKK
jgi:hypothetical protein